MYMILMLLIQELPYLYFLVIFLFFLVRLFYNATSTDAGKTRQGSKYSIQLVTKVSQVKIHKRDLT